MIDHELQVPLDHADAGGEQITVFAREVAEPEGRDKPFLVFFQGGPGHESFRPVGNPRGPGFLDRALKEFRFLLLDQRGTGRSTPVAGTERAEYLKHFRADSIVRDAELLREALGVERWSILGQSFGGFCVFAYLSIAPDALREALVTGGRSTTSTAPPGRGWPSATGATTRVSRRTTRGCWTSWRDSTPTSCDCPAWTG
jgi:pimeloyl-ACP methyl ester carboxylesterase